MSDTTFPIYVVLARRWGDRERHSYLVGVTLSELEADLFALAEEDSRGGKYSCEILRADLKSSAIEVVRECEQNPQIRRSGAAIADELREALLWVWATEYVMDNHGCDLCDECRATSKLHQYTRAEVRRLLGLDY